MTNYCSGVRTQMINKEKQVEELEKEFEMCKKNNSYPEYLIPNAKILKAEIEKGCGKNVKNTQRYCGEKDCFKLITYCPSCQNLINRLKKIIGEEE